MGPGIAQLWRTTKDISYEPAHAAWSSVVRNFEANALHAAFTAPNSWNDPDMLEVGNGGLTPVEWRSHFSMWAIAAAPLWAAGTDLTHMDADTRAILTDPEVIAVDQDPLGAGLRRVRPDRGGIEIWAKPLGRWSGGSQAVLLLNLASSKAMAPSGMERTRSHSERSGPRSLGGERSGPISGRVLGRDCCSRLGPAQDFWNAFAAALHRV